MVKTNRFWISISIYRIICLVLLTIFILFSLIADGSFYLISIAIVLGLLVIFTTTFIYFSKDELRVNLVKIQIGDVNGFSFSYKTKFLSKKVFLNITYNEKEISIPIYRFSKIQIERIVEELSKRTNIYEDNLNEYIPEIINNGFNKKVFQLKILIIIIVAINGIVLHDYVFQPFIYVDNEIWLNEEIEQLKFCDKEYFPKTNEVGNYESCSFHVFSHSSSILYNSKNDSFCLELVYSEEEYTIEVKKIMESVNFLTEPKKNPYYDEWLMPVTEFNIGKFLIKIIDISHYTLDMPFVAFDGGRIIRYCYQNIGGLSTRKEEHYLKQDIIEGFSMYW